MSIARTTHPNIIHNTHYIQELRKNPELRQSVMDKNFQIGQALRTAMNEGMSMTEARHTIAEQFGDAEVHLSSNAWRLVNMYDTFGSPEMREALRTSGLSWSKLQDLAVPQHYARVAVQQVVLGVAQGVLAQGGISFPTKSTLEEIALLMGEREGQILSVEEGVRRYQQGERVSSPSVAHDYATKHHALVEVNTHLIPEVRPAPVQGQHDREQLREKHEVMMVVRSLTPLPPLELFRQGTDEDGQPTRYGIFRGGGFTQITEENWQATPCRYMALSRKGVWYIPRMHSRETSEDFNRSMRIQLGRLRTWIAHDLEGGGVGGGTHSGGGGMQARPSPTRPDPEHLLKIVVKIYGSMEDIKTYMLAQGYIIRTTEMMDADGCPLYLQRKLSQAELMQQTREVQARLADLQEQEREQREREPKPKQKRIVDGWVSRPSPTTPQELERVVEAI